MLSQIAAALYLVVTALCLAAAGAAHKTGPQRRLGPIWIGIALLFVVLAASRLLDAENHLHAGLRLWLAGEGEYGARRSVQAPLAAIVLGIGGLSAIAIILRSPGRRSSVAERAVRWASRSAAAMVGLVALRVVSFHATDALLYKPLRLNWIIDLGLTLIVAVCAWRYCRASPSGRAGER